mgnify:CR=1 FL=1
MVTLEEVKNYLHVDFDDDDEILQSLIAAADEYLRGAVNPNYDTMSERAKMLSLIVISDLYDNRGISDKASGNVRKLVEDFSLQLKLESRCDDVETN